MWQIACAANHEHWNHERWRAPLTSANYALCRVRPPQSYGGGRDIVALDDSTLLEGQEFRRAPIFDDGLIEVQAVQALSACLGRQA